MKICRKCKERKNSSEFGVNKRESDEVHTWCKSCVNVVSTASRKKLSVEERRERWRKQAEKFRAANPRRARDLQMRALYGIGEDDYDALVVEQRGVCKICGRGPGKRRLHVDHDHETGRVRGLLCGGCNSALGLMQENRLIFLAAVEYLESSVAP